MGKFPGKSPGKSPFWTIIVVSQPRLSRGKRLFPRESLGCETTIIGSSAIVGTWRNVRTKLDR